VLRLFGNGSVHVSLAAVVLLFGWMPSLSAADARTIQDAERDTGSSTDTTIYEVSASSLRASVEEGKRVFHLEGGVMVEHQTTTITSGSGKNYPDDRYTLLFDGVQAWDGTMRVTGERGEYFGQNNVLIMEDNVRCVDKGLEITCNRARYDRLSRILVLTGDLVLMDSTRVMYADSIFYDREIGKADAVGHVVLVDEPGDYSIAGEHASFDRENREAVVDVEPVLMFDLGAAEKGMIKSLWMHFDLDQRIGTAIRNVEMVKAGTRARCDSAVIYDLDGRIELFGNPRVFSDRSGMTGDKIIMWYDDESVERIELPIGGRLTESPAEDSPWLEESWIEGDSVTIHLSEEKVDSVGIVGSSRTMYYPVEGEQGKVSNNYSSGDTMLFRFEDDELSYVRISGRSSGVYNFINISEEESIDSIASVIDTTIKYRDFAREAEKVRYSAELIEYFADSEDIVLNGKAVLEYQNKSLTADHINFNSRINVLEAIGEPVLEEDGQKMYGIDVGYDMDAGAGVIVDGSTKYEEGYYRGEHIFKVGEKTLNVYNSTYTTCDLKKPHYSMRSNRMKVYINDMIVSGPITLYIGEVPIFYLPFMANSLRRDRHSGILQPNFDIGINSRDGRFIRGLGYYWATNDYTDFKVTTDFNENASFRVFVDNRYKVRYMLDGGVQFNFYRNMKNFTNEWTVRSNHKQRFGKTASFNSDFRFVSSDKAQSAINSAQDVSRVVDRRIYSNASFSKSWGGTRLGLSATRNQKLNVNPDNPTEVRISATMPSFSLNLPRTSLWFGEKHKASEKGFWEKVLDGIMFSPNLRGARKTQESTARKKASIEASSSASFGQQFKLSFLNFSPGLGLSWSYYKDLYDRINPDYDDVVSPSLKYKNEGSMRLSCMLGTTLYGTFYPKVGPLLGLRHTFNPTATYSMTPKLVSSQTERQSVSYSIRNTFDAKILKGGKESNRKLLTWNLDGSYDPRSPKGEAFSSIRSGIQASISRLISIRLNHTYDPHNKKITSKTLSIGMNLSIGGSFDYPGGWTKKEKEKVAAAREETEPESDGEEMPEDRKLRDAVDEIDGRDEYLYGGPPPPTGGKGRSWSLNIDYSYSRSGSDFSERTDSKIDLGGRIQLTSNWNISYNAYYDIMNQSFSSQKYSITRDLHCWEASFIHRRFGNEWSYYFQIGIKAHKDIKYERGPRGLMSSIPYY